MVTARKIVCLTNPAMTLLIVFRYHIDPPDEILSASLHQYAKERLTTAQRLERLGAEHGLNIK